MLISLYIVIIYECILSVFMEGKFLLVFLVLLVNCQNFYGVSSSVKSLALQFDTIGQPMRLLACNPLLFFALCNATQWKVARRSWGFFRSLWKIYLSLFLFYVYSWFRKRIVIELLRYVFKNVQMAVGMKNFVKPFLAKTYILCILSLHRLISLTAALVLIRLGLLLLYFFRACSALQLP